MPVRKTTKATKVTPSLTRTELKRIAKLGAEWQLDDKHRKLECTFDFSSFLEAFMFVTRVSVHAEVLRHYPELRVLGNEVTIILSTPATKSVTEIDIDLAERINQIISTARAIQKR